METSFVLAIKNIAQTKASVTIIATTLKRGLKRGKPSQSVLRERCIASTFKLVIKPAEINRLTF